VLFDPELRAGYSLAMPWLVFTAPGSNPNTGIHGVDVSGNSAPTVIIDGEFNESAPALSPDGRWLAYVSVATGRPEVYVHPFPNTDANRWPISTNGGREPTWSPTGEELFYVDSDDNLIAARLDRRSAALSVQEEVLFSVSGYVRRGRTGHTYSVSPDGRRFLMIRHLPDAGTLVWVENWFEELEATLGN
jgi:Tol biopolymer transport system component